MKKSNKLIRLCSKYGIECKKEKGVDIFGLDWLKITLLINDDNRGQWWTLKGERKWLKLMQEIYEARFSEKPELIAIYIGDQKL